jgi:hypothetical protein
MLKKGMVIGWHVILPSDVVKAANEVRKVNGHTKAHVVKMALELYIKESKA